MPIANVVLTKEQFEFLQQNITEQYTTAQLISIQAESGLHYVVMLQVDAPEVDLVNPFADQLNRMDGVGVESNWTQIVAQLNTHAALRGATGTGTLTEKLNAYLENGGNRILVSSTYSVLSTAAGFIIDPCYIDPGTAGACIPGFTCESTMVLSNGAAMTPFDFTTVGTPTITVTHPDPYAGVVNPLPAGLSFGANQLTGTPTLNGTYNVVFVATNSVGATPKTFTISVA
jgi:hypothetical protein